MMRGSEGRAAGLFSYIRLEDRIAADHPLRAIRSLVDDVLGALSSHFATLYASTGRPSIPPEQLLRATLLQAFFSVRSERQAMEQVRKRIEEAFGWARTIGGIARLKVRGIARANAAFPFRMIACNLIRLPKIIQATA